MALENYSKDKFKLKPLANMKMMMMQGFPPGMGRGFNQKSKPKREKKFYKDLDAP